MNINDKALDNISQWLGQIGGVAPGVYGKALQIAAFVLFVYVKLPPTGRAITDKAAISALCLMHGLPISPYDADQVLRLLQEKRVVGLDGHVSIHIQQEIARAA